MALLALPLDSSMAADASPATAGTPVRGEGNATFTPVLPVTMLIARVLVNSVSKGDVAILRDAADRILVPAAELARWGLESLAVATVVVDGERYVALAGVRGLETRFDLRTVTLEITVVANAFAGTRIDLAPPRRSGVLRTADTSIFMNYGINASGDQDFGQRSYQFATEIGARTGQWLFYNTTSQQWGDTPPTGFTRLLTNIQYDERDNLRRWTAGDFFTPTFDLSNSVAMGGISLSKFYSMDPYFIQYPTAAFRTEVALPSTVQVRVDGNLIAQRQVQPGPVDISNISGVTGGQNVSVVLRDPFGRERLLQQPFFFATEAGLAEGLHEYSYNLGLLRRGYGIESNDYGALAASGFHRYAFTNTLTLGLRGQATRDLYNVGPFGTYQMAGLGIVGAGVSVGGRDGHTGTAGSLGYSWTGGMFGLNAGGRYLSRDYAQLADDQSPLRIRSNQYASGSFFTPDFGSLAVTYNALATYDGPQSTLWNVAYTRGLMAGKALLSLNYTNVVQPQSSSTWLLSFRYFFDSLTSAVAAVGGSSQGNTQAVSLQRSLPQGQGVGYELAASHVHGDVPDALLGRAYLQANAEHVAVGAEYARASRSNGGGGMSRAFVAGSLGYIDGSFFAARPVQDSFAMVRVADLPQVPVYANGWYVGTTDDKGEVVATNLAAYYDNFIAFGTSELPIDYVFDTAEKVISPPTRSGSIVAFSVKKNRAIAGTLVRVVDGQARAMEFRELRLTRGSDEIRGFTARRGEFYVEGIEPGMYRLRLDGEPACSASLVVPALTQAVTDVGRVTCEAGTP